MAAIAFCASPRVREPSNRIYSFPARFCVVAPVAGTAGVRRNSLSSNMPVPVSLPLCVGDAATLLLPLSKKARTPGCPP